MSGKRALQIIQHTESRRYAPYVFLLTLALLCSLNLSQGSEVSANSTTAKLEVEPRIIGGTQIPSAQTYPFLAQTAGNKLCTASLIWPDILISAGQCADAFASGIFLGGIRLDGSDAVFHAVSEVLVHPKYRVSAKPYDILLVKLSTASSAKFVNIPTPANAPEGTAVTVLGFGLTSSGGNLPYAARQVSVKVSNFKNCQAIYGSDVNNSLQFCTSTVGGKGSCKGDAGGPVLDSNGNLVGLVSFGAPVCTTPNMPDVNTRLSTFRKWTNRGICSLSATPPTSCKRRLRLSHDEGAPEFTTNLH
jgi:secreted trypsin-like serine protease